MSSAITGITLILGLFIYKNNFDYLEITSLIVIGIYLIFLFNKI